MKTLTGSLDRLRIYPLLLAAFALQCNDETESRIAPSPATDCRARVTNAPFPGSPVIAGLEFDFSTHRREASGSDNWPLTWAEDGHQYTAWGDGFGFEESAGFKVSLGFSRIEGGPTGYTGHDVFLGDPTGSGRTFDAKSIGVLTVRGDLYAWIAPGSEAAHWRRARLYKSEDHGASWSFTGVEFTRADGFGYPWFLQAGRNYSAAEDNFVYSYFTEIQDGRWDAQRPGEIVLARVPLGAIEQQSRYRFFAGLDEEGAPVWSPDPSDRRPVIRDPNGLLRGSAIYVPSMDRYLVFLNHSADASGNVALFDAPDPWGPWTTVFYEFRWGGPEIPPTTFYWNFSPKWFDRDGRDFVLVFSGTGENDSWNTVQGSFVLCEGGSLDEARSVSR